MVARAENLSDQFTSVTSTKNIWWVNQKTRINGRLANEIVWSPCGEPGSPEEQWHWRTMWDVKEGDTILHFSDQHIVAISSALTGPSRAQNPYQNDIWGRDGKQVMVDITWLEIPISKTEISLEVRQRAFYNKGPFQRSGKRVKLGYFFPVGDELWTTIRDLAALDLDRTNEEILDQDLSFTGPSDVETVIKGRKEQAQLRRRLLRGRENAICGICGRNVPAHYLHATHIKKRSEANERERRDPNIAMLTCGLGCNQAFVSGDIRVKADGTIGLAYPTSEFVKQTFGYLVGKVAPAHSPSTSKYFTARMQSFD